ncbi:hypothetical protein MHC_04585 [Mycoplasma haemocanis str. Illinois]|uniref:Uncharacterized protein n=1 Tax=Mycoplasma haemocanis (strain Illinois) TaxID=1111676 RepID=H6N801_MYCHN|nr:hypothetical protein [Mycoplasma haemocanis]AEW45773.1 hypothetical protein MHC_04585 [Mycoplasma haemocanis str. Illinois]
MSLSIKPLLCLAGAGVVSTGSFFVISSLRKSEVLSVKNRLEKSGYSILNLNKQDTIQHSSEWEQVKEAYGSEADANLKFDNVITKDDNTIGKMKDACSSLLSKESYSSDDLEKARRWCAVPVTVASRIGDNFKFMDTQGTNDSSLWQATLQEYKTSGSSILKMPVTPSSGDTVSEDDLKKECGKVKDYKTFQKDFETFVLHAKNWCTKAK